MIYTEHGNYLTETPENDKDIAELAKRFPHLPKGPISYVPGKSKGDLEQEREMRWRAIYPGIRIPRRY